MKPQPKWARLSLAARPISTAIQSKSTITDAANSAVIRRNARSPKFASRPSAKRSRDRGRTSDTSEWVVSELEQFFAGARDVLQASFDRSRPWPATGVVERLGEGADVVETPPNVLGDGLSLGRSWRRRTRACSCSRCIDRPLPPQSSRATRRAPRHFDALCSGRHAASWRDELAALVLQLRHRQLVLVAYARSMYPMVYRVSGQWPVTRHCPWRRYRPAI